MPPSISHEGYSDKPAYSYWNSCSTGGRQGYLLAQELGDQLDPAKFWPIHRPVPTFTGQRSLPQASADCAVNEKIVMAVTMVRSSKCMTLIPR